MQAVRAAGCCCQCWLLVGVFGRWWVGIWKVAGKKAAAAAAGGTSFISVLYAEGPVIEIFYRYVVVIV